MAAWLGFRRLRLRLDAEIARDAEESPGLSMADYDVLSSLESADAHTVRIGVLAQSISWSQSRLSRQLSRMRSRGLVDQVPVRGDRRGFAARLTPAGKDAITRSAPVT